MMKKIYQLFEDGPNSINAILKKFCGEMIGSGCYRDVYLLKQYPDYVVKIERDMTTGNFANAMEWRNYINNEYFEKFSSWLAPCVLINETGQLLVQQKVEFKARKFYPKKIPSYFTDKKISNFGWIGDQFVCCDYSFLLQDKYYMKNVRWENA